MKIKEQMKHRVIKFMGLRFRPFFFNKKLFLFFIIFKSINFFAQNSCPEILVGADQPNLYLPLLKNKSIGVIVNHTSISPKLNKHLVDILLENNINLKKIFTPEHGLSGVADAGEKIDSKNYYKNIEVISLYGKNFKPQREDLQNIDILVFDIQDVGARFYTYVSTMFYAMQASAENKISFLILDRPNPNGFYVDGPVLKPEFKSFVGVIPIPIVYGLTLAELAHMINGEKWLIDKNNMAKAKNINFKLNYILCKNYNHNSRYNLPIKPSPNLPNSRSIFLYPSLCFFEGTQISVGRGTDFQFQIIGSPNLDKDKLRIFKDFIEFIPVSKPGAQNPIYINKTCYGLNLQKEEIKNNNQINLNYLLNLYSLFEPKEQFFLKSTNLNNQNNSKKEYFFDLLAGTDELRKQIETYMHENEIRKSWEPDLENFKKLREKYFLY